MATPRSQIGKRGMGAKAGGTRPRAPNEQADTHPRFKPSPEPLGYTCQWRGTWRSPGANAGLSTRGHTARGRPGCRRCGRQRAADGKHRPGAGTHGGLGLGREEGSKLDLPSLEQGAKCNKMKHDRANVASGPAAPKPSGRAPDGAWSFSPTISSVRVSGVHCIPKGKSNSGCLCAA